MERGGSIDKAHLPQQYRAKLSSSVLQTNRWKRISCKTKTFGRLNDPRLAEKLSGIRTKSVSDDPRQYTGERSCSYQLTKSSEEASNDSEKT